MGRAVRGLDVRARLLLLLAGVVVLVAVVMTADGGVLARWSLAEDLGTTGTVGTGVVELGAAPATATLSVGGVAFDPATDTLHPGQTLRLELPMVARATGTAMVPYLTLGTSAAGSSVDDWIVAPLTTDHVTITSDAESVMAGLVVGQAEQAVTVAAEIAVASTARFGAVDLDDVEAVLRAREGSGWTDTHVLPDLGIVTIAPVTAVTAFTCNTALGACTFTTRGSWGAKTVDWGDGTTGQLVADGSPNTHTFPRAGVYHVQVDATYTSLAFTNNPAGLVSLDRWDETTGATGATSMFQGARNLRTSVEPPSTVVTFSSMFRNATVFDDPAVSTWDVTGVEVMTSMFEGASAFNRSLEAWDVSDVQRTDRMFFDAAHFNKPLARWDVSSVLNMSAMFSRASAFDQPLEPWDVTSVRSMDLMFSEAVAFDQPLDEWEPSAATTTASMFSQATRFNHPLDGWDVSSVGDMTSMFQGATSFDQPLEGWDVTSVTTMTRMFNRAVSFNQPLVGWEVSNVTSTSAMFEEARSFNQPLEGWDVSGVTLMSGMFRDAWDFDQPLEGWEVSEVTSMLSMFAGAWSFNQPLEEWDVSGVTSMAEMFSGAWAFDQPLDGWDVSSVIDMHRMFVDATSFNHPLGTWDVTSIGTGPAGSPGSLSQMFSGAMSFDQDLRCWDVRTVTSMPVDFALDAPIQAIHLPSWGTVGECAAVQDAQDRPAPQDAQVPPTAPHGSTDGAGAGTPGPAVQGPAEPEADGPATGEPEGVEPSPSSPGLPDLLSPQPAV